MTLAFLVLLEKLSPEERAVFLLKDDLRYDHEEVAGCWHDRGQLAPAAAPREGRGSPKGRPRWQGRRIEARGGRALRARVLERRRVGADGAADQGRRAVERRRRQGVRRAASAHRPRYRAQFPARPPSHGPDRGTGTRRTRSTSKTSTPSRPSILRVDRRLESFFVFSIEATRLRASASSGTPTSSRGSTASCRRCTRDSFCPSPLASAVTRAWRSRRAPSAVPSRRTSRDRWA